MNELRIVSEYEYEDLEHTYPTIFWIGDKNNGFIRYSPPVSYTFLGANDGIFRCEDGDFLLKEN